MAAVTKARVVEGSCWPCRKRRVKCDLARPVCGRCQATSSADCDYGASAPVKWVGGTALRGRNAPRQASKIDDTAQTQDLTLQAPSSGTPLDTESLLLYFSNAVLPRFHITDEPPPLDIGAIKQDYPLQQAILAVSQAHHDMFSHATSSASLVCRRRARHSAIQILRHRLQLGLDSATAAQELFSVAVLLCMLDGMIEPNEQANACVFHLKGGYALVQGDTNLPTKILSHGGLQAHLLSIFATIDLVHALLSGERPFFDPFIWYMFSETEAWFGRLGRNDRFLAILKVFSEMASLGHIVSSQLPSTDGLRLVDTCLPPIETALASRTYNAAAHPLDPSIWTTFCDLYELCAEIYLNRCLRLLPIDDERVQAATRKGIAQLVAVALPGMIAHCVIFPVLVIGAHATRPQDRETILKAISPSKEYLSFGNLQVMVDLLTDMWSDPNPDMQADWWQCFRPVSDKVFLF